MQPYFLPYLGYWQLLAAVDQFVVYDNIEYTKKGWINRNRFLRNGADAPFTLPLKKGSDFLHVRERSLADDFKPAALLNPFRDAYRRAPYFDDVFPLIETIVTAAPKNLFDYLLHSLMATAAYLEIKTPIIVSSTVPIDHSLKAGEKVLAMCGALGANRYLNAIGGQALYAADAFTAAGVELKFIQTRPLTYPQLGQPFVPGLSILDVMMFNSPDAVRRLLGEYDLL